MTNFYSEEILTMTLATPLKSLRATLLTSFVAVSLFSSASCGRELDVGTVATGSAVAAATITQTSGDLAFPGAEGYGKFAAGGRDGAIMFVTTTADAGPGSLRACIEASGPRTCVFRVGGVFRFTSQRPLIRNPFLTIAGQTAPGDGVLITHDGGESGRTPIAIKNTHDIVIRHVRVRLDKIAAERGSNDAFTIENSRNVILDHVSGSWALDENVNGHGDNDAITVSWSIFAEGIPRHDKCALLSSDPKGPQNFSFVNNVCAHNGDRNPDINFPPGSCVDVINNVFYNAQSEFAEVWESEGGSPVNIVGNYFKAGPDTVRNAPAIIRQTIASSGDPTVFLEDNLLDGVTIETAGGILPFLSDEPVCPLSVEPIAAADAYDNVLSHAGAFPRDTFDARIVQEVRTRTGEIVRQPGQLSQFSSDTPDDDLDNDGMTDSWERANGIDDTVFNPWGDHDEDGWRNLDEFLDALHNQLLQTD